MQTIKNIAETKFKELSEAYAVLSDEEQKSKYDQFGHAGAPRGGWNANFNPEDIFGGSDFFGGQDPFSVFFGGRRQRRGDDVKVQISITLEEAAKGVEKHISYKQRDRCAKCHGIGGTGKPCTTCGGHGKVQQQRSFMNMITTCPGCMGKKTQIDNICTNCKGEGRTENNKTISLKIPSGVDNGSVLNVSGGGNLNDHALPRGNFYCHITVQQHNVFSREGVHLICKRKLTFKQACLGASVKIPTIYDKNIELKIPSGTQFGQIFKVTNQGMPQLNGVSKGDLLVRVEIDVPKKMSKKAQDLLKDLDKLLK